MNLPQPGVFAQVDAGWVAGWSNPTMMGAPTGDPHVVKHVLLFFVASAGCAVAYMVTCWWRPYAACIWCKGKRIYRSSSGRTWRRCPICKGTGERLRVGRVLWNWWRKGRGTR